MTLEELAQQVQAMGSQLHNAAKSIVDSQLLGSCLSKGSRGAGRTGGPQRCTHDHPAAQPSSDQRISGSSDQRISGSSDQRISGSAQPSSDQRISGSSDQRVSGSSDQRISGAADHRISGSAGPAAQPSSDQRISGSSDQRIRGSCAPYPPRTHACYAHTCTDSFDRRIDLACQYTCMASVCRIIQHLSQGLQVTSTERVHWLMV